MTISSSSLIRLNNFTLRVRATLYNISIRISRPGAVRFYCISISVATNDWTSQDFTISSFLSTNTSEICCFRQISFFSGCETGDVAASQKELAKNRPKLHLYVVNDDLAEEWEIYRSMGFEPLVIHLQDASKEEEEEI